MNEANRSFSFVLTHKRRLYVALTKTRLCLRAQLQPQLFAKFIKSDPNLEGYKWNQAVKCSEVKKKKKTHTHTHTYQCLKYELSQKLFFDASSRQGADAS